MKVSDIIARVLKEQGFSHVFAISGGASLHLIHSFAETPGIKVICPQHEQAGAMAADAYSRLTNGRGCAVATSGPGATNLITGIAGAYYDSVPVLFLTGNVARFRDKGSSKVRQMGFQETEFVEMCRSITNYAVKVKNPAEVKAELLKALWLSRHGRPGPVLVDLPDDLQRMDFDPGRLKPWHPPKRSIISRASSGLSRDISLAQKWLHQSKRPCLVLGWGVHLAGAEAKILRLVDKLGVPVVMTWAALDLLSYRHPLAVGGFGTHGTRYANFTIQNADFLLVLGSRLDTKATGSPPDSFARGAKIVMVDIDGSEINKFKKLGKKIDLGIKADLKEFVDLFAKKTRQPWKEAPTMPWKKQIALWKKSYPQMRHEQKQEKAVNPYYFVKILSKILSPGDIIISETGCALAWLMQAFEFKKGQRFLHAFNFTAMGWGLPGAIGAAFANPGRRIICVAGDGSLQMNLQELVTVTRHKLPIKIILINNHGHSMVQQTQEMWLGGKYYATSLEGGLAFPNFVRVAQAYGYPVARITRNKDLQKNLSKMIHRQGYSFVDVEISRKHRVTPQVQYGRPNEDSSPLLARSEFLKNMFIPPLHISASEESEKGD